MIQRYTFELIIKVVLHILSNIRFIDDLQNAALTNNSSQLISDLPNDTLLLANVYCVPSTFYVWNVSTVEYIH
jgi:hypothetical protein